MTPKELAELEPRIERLAHILDLSINSCDDYGCCPRPTSSPAEILERAIDRINVLDALAESRSRLLGEHRQALGREILKHEAERQRLRDMIDELRKQVFIKVAEKFDKSTRELGSYVLALENKVKDLEQRNRSYHEHDLQIRLENIGLKQKIAATERHASQLALGAEDV